MREALFWEPMDGKKVRCLLCPHRCVISEGKKGVCGVREHRKGKLYALTYGVPCSLGVDPMEKKPLYHFLPGSKVFSIATVGCNLGCKWCQNWEISHPLDRRILAPYGEVTPAEVIAACVKQSCNAIAFTYTEPTVYYEYMLDIAKRAKKAGIRTVMVSNGYIEESPLRELIPFLDAANIDLKSFSDDAYKEWTNARLEPVLATIKRLHEAGVHLELTTLVVPGVNDDDEQLEELYAWIEQELGKDQVVHISRFFPHYKAGHLERTAEETMERAASIARGHLQHVYLGNMGRENDTACPKCGKTVVTRTARSVKTSLRQGKCSCGQAINGVWE